MDFGIALPTAADYWKVVQRAEELGFTPRLVLRHPDAERRLLRRHGRGGGPHAEDPARHRRAGAVQPHRAGGGQCAGDAQPAGARAASISASAPASPRGAPWASARSRSRTWRPMCTRSMACCAARRSTSRWRGRSRRSASSIPSCRCSTPQDPIALHFSAFGPRTRALTAKFKAGWIDFVGKVENGVKEVQAMQAAWREAGHAMSDLYTDGLRAGLRAAGRRAGRLRARHGAGGAARRGDAASRRRRGAGGPEAGRRHAVEARPRSTATSSSRAASSRRTRAISRTIAAT